MGAPNGIVRSQKGADMGTPDSIAFTPDEIELAKTMAFKSLDGQALHGLRLDSLLLELNCQEYIRRHLSDLGGYEPLENQSESGIESTSIWNEAMYRTPLRDTRCVRLTKHGIGMYRDGKLVLSVLVFMTRRLEWITAISENRPDSDWQWPRDFTHHNQLEDLYLWSEQLIKDEGFDRFDSNDVSFVIGLAQALHDLLRKSIQRRRETLNALESAELGMRMQNMRFTGYQYLSRDRDYCIKEGLM
jgi:hypothetical protein